MTPLLHDLASTVQMLGISRSRLFEEIKAGHIETVKLGKRTMIKHAELVRYVDALGQTQAA